MKDLTFFSIGLVIGSILTKTIKDLRLTEEELRRERAEKSPRMK